MRVTAPVRHPVRSSTSRGAGGMLLLTLVLAMAMALALPGSALAKSYTMPKVVIGGTVSGRRFDAGGRGSDLRFQR